MHKLLLFLLLNGSALAQTTVTPTLIDRIENPGAKGTVSDISTEPNAAAAILRPNLTTTDSINASKLRGMALDSSIGTVAVEQQPTENPARNKIMTQSKAMVDVRNLSGVDCTGTADSSMALNNLTGVDGITGKTLSFRGCPSIMLSNQWLIKGEEYAEIDLGGAIGTGGQVQGGTNIFGCSGTADAVIRIDDSGYVNFHGGTIEAKGSSCTSNFVGSIRVTNSQTGGYTSTRNTFRDLLVTSNIGGTAISNYYGMKIDGSPNQEGFAFHHVWVNCQNSSGSYGIWVNDGNADSTDIDQEAMVTACYQGLRVDAGLVRVYNSHIGGNGSYATFGSGGANFFEAQNGCLSVITGVVAAENSGAFINGSGYNGAGCWRSIYNNTISFPNIDPALYVIRATGGHISLWNNDFSNGGVAVTVHNNTIVGDDTNGLRGPSSQVFDLGGNNLYDSGNGGNYLLTLQPYYGGETHLGPTSVSTLSGGYPPAGTSFDWALLPNGGPINNGNAAAFPSSRLIFSRALYGSTAPVLDQFAIRNVGDSQPGYTGPTLALTYKQPSGYSFSPSLAFQPPVSGLTFSQVSAPQFDPYVYVTNTGTSRSTTYTYQLVALGGCGTSAGSTTGSTTTGNATLSSTNYNVIHIQATGGAWGFAVYRTYSGGTPSSIGKIGTALATDYNGGGIGYLTFNDTGLAGDGTTAPASNTSGCLNLPSGATYQINGSQISSSNLSDGPFTQVYKASLTTTSATSDNVSITGATSSSHCSLAATNSSAAANIATTYISAKTTNQITVRHTTTTGMTYDILCTPN